MDFKRLVLDTSVVIKWFAHKDEEGINKALQLLEEIQNNKIEAIVCEFIYYEVSNVLYWGKKLNKNDYISAIKTLFSLPFVIYPLSEELIEDIYISMNKFKLSLYDVFPVVIANINHTPLITADEKHHKGLPNVIFLNEYNNPFQSSIKSKPLYSK